MKKIMIVFGTRPEAIKMCPVIKALNRKSNISCIVCVTGQHKEMLKQVLDVFGIVPQYDLSVMKSNQNLFELTTNILMNIKGVLEREQPDLVLVHGDTTTTFVASLACFYLKIPVGHVEAGLRTNNIYSPFPEEFNRKAVDIISEIYFVPTEHSKQNLLNEGKCERKILVTGNTAIDALKTTVDKNYTHPYLDWAKDSRLIVVTAHRRENLGQTMKGMFNSIKRICNDYPDIKVLFPIHKNPNVREIAESIFKDTEQIRIVEPLNVVEFHNILAKSYLILTDSGGIQEEAPSLNVPVVVMRSTTERPEGIEAGTLVLAGTEEEEIYDKCKMLLENEELYKKIANAVNPFGDGKASDRIADFIDKWDAIKDTVGAC